MAALPPPSSETVISRADALAAGLKRYFTGKPCKRGHVAERYTSSPGCVICAADDRAAWAAANPDKLKEGNKKSKSRPEFKEKHAARERERYRATNPDWRRPRELTSEERAAEARELRRAYYKKRREYLLSISRKCRAKRKKAEGTHNDVDIENIIRLQKSKCAYCKTSITQKYHVDHIQPLAKGGSNWPNNLQVLCQPCNNKKAAKDPIKFAQENGRLL